jgi:hypothetical protein
LGGAEIGCEGATAIFAERCGSSGLFVHHVLFADLGERFETTTRFAPSAQLTSAIETHFVARNCRQFSARIPATLKTQG